MHVIFSATDGDMDVQQMLTRLSGSSLKSSQRLRPVSSSQAITALWHSRNAFFILSRIAGGSSAAFIFRRFCNAPMDSRRPNIYIEAYIPNHGRRRRHQ